MKVFSTFLVGFTIASTAHAGAVFQCVDGEQIFTVSQKYDGTYSGRLVNQYGVSSYGKCLRNGRGYAFRCYNSNAIATVTRTRVEIALDGEFAPYNSDVVTTLSCQ